MTSFKVNLVVQCSPFVRRGISNVSHAFASIVRSCNEFTFSFTTWLVRRARDAEKILHENSVSLHIGRFIFDGI